MERIIIHQDISWFLDLHHRGKLDLNPPYQRRSVWTPKDKRFFIDTILNNYPAPPIFLHRKIDDQGDSMYHVVDGKQRLLTIIEFRDNEIRVPDDFIDISIRKEKWKELPKEFMQKFWNYTLIVEMLPQIDNAVIRDVFERINRNYRKLMPQELRHARYSGWFIEKVEAEVERQEWSKLGLVTIARKKRMMDVQFMSEIFEIVLKKKLLGFEQNRLDKLYADYDVPEEFSSLFDEEDFFNERDKAKNFIIDMTDKENELKAYIKKQGHFYSLWGFLVLEGIPQNKQRFAERYLDYLKQVEKVLSRDGEEVNISEEVMNEYGHSSLKMSANLDVRETKSIYENSVNVYAHNLRGASTDLGPRTKRHNALIQALGCSKDKENS